MRINSLPGVSHTALSGLSAAISGIEGVAHSVASASSDIESGDFSQKIGSLANLPVYKMHAKANAQVFRTANTLFEELSSLRKK